MNFLYIGQYTEGTTSKMRANQLVQLLHPLEFSIIDTHVPFYKACKLIRSIGFRYKKGPLIRQINNYIQQKLVDGNYDLIWIDKGVFINKKTIALLRNKTKKLVHFTPDPAFTFHQSKLFLNSIVHYDYVITTKSFELQNYYEYISKNRVIYVTQGFDKNIHKKGDIKFSEKKGVVFLGHHETGRQEVIEELLKHQVSVTLAGINWSSFVSKHEDNQYLNYLGDGVYGEAYVKTLQEAKIAWGAISKWIPEKHTTRTFEIPACGTALLTESNDETTSFFQPSEAIFYSDQKDLISKVMFYLNHDEELEKITIAGYNAVQKKGFDYESIMRKALRQIRI